MKPTLEKIEALQKKFYITNVPEEKIPFLNLGNPWLKQRSVINPFRYLFGKYYFLQQMRFGTISSRLMQNCLTLELERGLDRTKTRIRIKLFNRITIGRWVYYNDEGVVYGE